MESSVILEKSKKALTGKTILAVDDEPGLLYNYSALLSANGMKVIKMENGFLATKYMLSEEGNGIDAIITDNNMPIMTGFHFLTAIIHKRYGGIEGYLSSPMFTILNSALTIDDDQYKHYFGRTKAELPTIRFMEKPLNFDTVYIALAKGLKLIPG